MHHGEVRSKADDQRDPVTHLPLIGGMHPVERTRNASRAAAEVPGEGEARGHTLRQGVEAGEFPFPEGIEDAGLFDVVQLHPGAQREPMGFAQEQREVVPELQTVLADRPTHVFVGPGQKGTRPGAAEQRSPREHQWLYHAGLERARTGEVAGDQLVRRAVGETGVEPGGRNIRPATVGPGVTGQGEHPLGQGEHTWLRQPLEAVLACPGKVVLKH